MDGGFVLRCCYIYIPDDVLLILCAPSLGAEGLPRPLPEDKGFARVTGGGAAMAAKGSSASLAVELPALKGLDDVLGAGAAIEPHKSSSSSLGGAFTIFFGCKLVADGLGCESGGFGCETGRF